MPIPLGVTRFNRAVTNRITRIFAGRAPGFALLTHVGRRSGRSYTIPINTFRDGEQYVIALTYGPNTDWVKNVLAANGCEIITRGQRVRLSDPRILTDTERSWAPPLARLLVNPLLNAMGVTQVMRLTRVG